MRIHSVTMTGFGPFVESTTVDFDKFLDDGIFVITGPTGAGKSSILDAVTFALFGRVPRYTGHGVAADMVRNRSLEGSVEPTEVVLEFTQDERRYRVTRRPEWTKQGNRTPTPKFAEIAEVTGSQETVLVSRRIKDVDETINGIVKLNDTQFNQVALLAQGEFQKFLLASSDDRRKVLRQLFGTRRFENWSDEVFERAKSIGSELSHTHERIRTLLQTISAGSRTEVPEGLAESDSELVVKWLDELLTVGEAELRQAENAAEVAKELEQRAASRFAELEKVQKNQERRAAAEKELAALRARDEEVEQLREELAAARKAAPVMPLVRAHENAQREVAAAREEVEAALARAAELGLEVAVDDESLDAALDSLVVEVAELTKLLPAEEELDEHVRLAEQAEETERLELEQVSKNTETLSGIKLKIGELLAAAKDLSVLADERGAAESAWKELETRLASAGSAVKLKSEWKARAIELDEHREQLRLLESELSELQRRRLAQNVGELAHELVPGEPCQVCGSVEHPNPALRSDDVVTDEQVKELTSSVEGARARDTELSAADAEAKTRWDEARKLAGDATVEELEQLVETAAERHRTALGAHEELLDSRSRREALEEESQELQERLDKAKELAGEARLAAAKARARADELVRTLVEARGAHETVAARLSESGARLGALRDCKGSRERTIAALHALQEACSSVENACAEHGFADAAEVADKYREVTVQEELEENVQNHRANKDKLVGQLADPELSGLPDEFVDTAEASAGLTEAREALQVAQAGLGAERTRMDLVRDSSAKVEAELARDRLDRERHDVLKRLGDTMRGREPNQKKISLESYVLAGDLEEIVGAANALLGPMTNGRYELILDDGPAAHGAQSGLGIDVLDAWNDEVRPPESLSGGEKFQASLALALGLAEVVTSRSGGVRLDTLFIDEGFGALDDETLDEVLSTIDGLRSSGRTVGVISHVAAVKERIAGHVEVTPDESGGSSVRVQTP